MTIILRPDQGKFDNDLDAAHSSGSRYVLGVAVTGFGKSVVMSHRVRKRHLLGSADLLIAHRKEIVGQLSGHIARVGIPHRIIASRETISQIVNEHRREFGRSYINPDARTAVAGVDTIVARADVLAPYLRQIDRWYQDEAHHVVGNDFMGGKRPCNKWARAISYMPNATGEGYTASPCRSDGLGLGAHHDGVFHQMVLGPTMRQTIDAGNLCDYQLVLAKSDLEVSDDDLTDSGDYSPKKLKKAADKSHIVGDVVQEYVKHALGKRAICFATDVENAGKIASNFNAVGIPAAAVSAETPSDVRAEYIRRFRDGRLWVLVNVDLFGEGFDVPACEVVIMARPTASLGLYLQMFGRALRLLTGKLYGMIIDLVGNWKKHGYPDKPHDWTLDRRDSRGKRTDDPELIPQTACRSCTRPYARVLTACPWCGAEPPLPPPGAGRTIEQVDGDLVLLDPETLAQMRAATFLPEPADVAGRVAHVAGAAAGAHHANKAMAKAQAQSRLKLAYAQYAAIKRQAGETDSMIHRRLYLALGIDMLTALNVERSTSEYTGTAEKIEEWYGTL